MLIRPTLKLLWLLLLWTWVCKHLLESPLSLLWGVFLVYLGVELMDSLVIPWPVFWGTTRMFSRVTRPLYVPTSSAQRIPNSPHAHQHLLLCPVFWEWPSQWVWSSISLQLAVWVWQGCTVITHKMVIWGEKMDIPRSMKNFGKLLLWHWGSFRRGDRAGGGWICLYSWWKM